MAEQVGSITFFKTDDGMKIEVSGDVMKQMGCCCVPMGAASDCCGSSDGEAKAVKIVCCEPSDKK